LIGKQVNKASPDPSIKNTF